MLPEPSPEYLFAYGTLRPGSVPSSVAPVVQALVSIGPGTSPGILYDLGDFPGATFDPHSSSLVHGHVYQFKVGWPQAMRRTAWFALDRYEGVPDLYTRLTVAVTLPDGLTLDCWAYQHNDDLTARRTIPSGHYIAQPRP